MAPPRLFLILVAGLLLAATPRLRADVLAEATALIAAERLPEAREPLEALVAREPDNLEARLTLAKVYHGLGRREDGIQLLEPALAKHPEDARVLGIYAGQCLLRAGELGMGFRALKLARRGRELMERAVALDPDEIAYREGLVDFYRQAPGLAGGSVTRAREHAEAIARLDPVRGGAWLAALLVDEGRYAEALAACDAALAKRPDDYVALFTLGKTVSECGLRLEDGEAALRRCLTLQPRTSEPSHAGVWHRLGLIAEQRGEFSSARDAQREALKREPYFTRASESLRRLEKRERQ